MCIIVMSAINDREVVAAQLKPVLENRNQALRSTSSSVSDKVECGLRHERRSSAECTERLSGPALNPPQLSLKSMRRQGTAVRVVRMTVSQYRA